MIRYQSGKHVKRKDKRVSTIRARFSTLGSMKNKRLNWQSISIPPPDSMAAFLDGTVSPISRDSSQFMRLLIGSSLSLRQSETDTLWRWNLSRSSPQQILSILSNSELDRARYLPIHPTPILPILTELDLIEFPSLSTPLSNYLTKFMAMERSGKKDLLVFIHAEAATKLLQKAAAAKDSDDILVVSRCLQGAMILGTLLTTRIDQMLLSMTFSLWTFLQIGHSQIHDVGLEKERFWSVINGLSMECSSFPSGFSQILSFLDFSITMKMKKEHKDELKDSLRRILIARTEDLPRRKDKEMMIEKEEERVEEEEIIRMMCEMVDRGVQTGNVTRRDKEIENNEDMEVEITLSGILSDVVRKEEEGQMIKRWSICTQTPDGWNDIMIHSPIAYPSWAKSMNNKYHRPLHQFANELNESIYENDLNVKEEAKAEKKIKVELCTTPSLKVSKMAERVLRSGSRVKIEEGEICGRRGRKEKEKETKKKEQDDKDVLKMKEGNKRRSKSSVERKEKGKKKGRNGDGESITSLSDTIQKDSRHTQSGSPLDGIPSISFDDILLSTPLHSPPRLISSSPIREVSPDGMMDGISPVRRESSQPPLLEREERMETVEIVEEDDEMKGRERYLSGKKKKTRESRGISQESSSNNSYEQPCTSSRKRKMEKDSDDDFDKDKDTRMLKRRRGRPPKSLPFSTPGTEILGMVRQLREKSEEEWDIKMETSENRPTREKKPIKLYDPTPRTPKKRSRSKSRRRRDFESQSIRLVYDEEMKEVEANSSEGEMDREREDPDYEIENEEEMEGGEKRVVYQIDGSEWNGVEGASQMSERSRQRTMRNKIPLWNGIPLQLPAVISVDSVIQVVERTEGAVEGLIEDERRLEEGEGGGERMECSGVSGEHSYTRRIEDTLNEEIIDVVTVDDEMEIKEEKKDRKKEKEIDSIDIGNEFNIDDDVEEIHEIIEGSFEENTANMVTPSPSRHSNDILNENIEIMEAIKEIVDKVCEEDGEKREDERGEERRDKGEDKKAIQGIRMRNIDGKNEEKEESQLEKDEYLTE